MIDKNDSITIETYTDIFNKLPIGIYIYKLDNLDELIFKVGNHYANNMFKIDYSKFIGKKIGEVFPFLKDTQIPKESKRVAKGGGSWKTNYLEYSDEKISKAFEVEVFQIKPQYIAMMFNDLTKNKIQSIECNKRIEDLVYLSNTALDIARLTSKNSIYQYFGSQLKELVGDAIITVASYNKKSNFLISRGVFGLENKQKEIMKILGRDPIGYSIKIKNNTFLQIRTGTLIPFVYDIEKITKGGIAKTKMKLIRKLLKINKSYAIAFVHKEETFGVAIISIKEGNELRNIELLEAFANQVSIALLRFELERVLLESDHKYRTLIETMTDGLGIDDKEGIFTYTNRELCKMLGYTKEELVEKPVIDFIDPDFAKIYLEKMNMRQKGITDVYEIPMINKNGEKVFTLIKPNSMFDQDGYYIGSFAVITDITEIKKANEKLRQNQILLQRQKDELESFASTVAHDFRGKIQIISALADMEPTEYTSMIIGQLGELENFINNLLILAQKGSILGEKIDIDLYDFVNDIAKSIFYIQKNMSYDIKDLPIIKADPIKLTQVFENLFMNIIKHSKATIVKVYIKERNNEFQIIIEDNGKGISKIELEAIKKSWITRRFRSFGILIVLKIIEAHNGRIDIESEVGIGTKVSLFFPKKLIDINKKVNN